jgi:hypothetical protein
MNKAPGPAACLLDWPKSAGAHSQATNTCFFFARNKNEQMMSIALPLYVGPYTNSKGETRAAPRQGL